MTPLRRRRMVAEGIAISAVLWAILAACAWIFDARPPSSRALYVSGADGTVVARHWDQWGRAALFGLLGQAKWLKSWLMFRRTPRDRHSRIGWCLIWGNFSLAIVSVYWLLLLLWPALRSDYPWAATWGWLLRLAAASVWEVVELSLSTDPIDPARGVVLERDETTGVVYPVDRTGARFDRRRRGHDRRRYPPPPRSR